MESLGLVMAGGAVGTLLRFYVSGLVNRLTGNTMPWGTFTVNIVGSFVLGLGIPSASLHPHWFLAVDVGALGSLTTFSSLSYESMRLIQNGEVYRGLGNLVVSVGVGLAAAGLGIVLGTHL